MASSKFPHALFWADFETTGLSFEDDHILEVGVIITDFDLNPLSGYEEVVKLTKVAADRLRKDDYVLSMHKASGLLQASAKATMTVAEVEQELITLIQETTPYGKGEFIIAGSGVGHFDHQLIQKQMPELATYFQYYPFDIGTMRRVTKILAGRDVVNKTIASYGDQKMHRAYNDVSAHLEESGKYRDWLRGLDAEKAEATRQKDIINRAYAVMMESKAGKIEMNDCYRSVMDILAES